MLCMVTQTDTTLSTGDHSLPRMEAHIYVIQASGISTASPHPRNKARTCPLEYTCCQGGNVHKCYRSHGNPLMREWRTYWMNGGLVFAVYDELDSRSRYRVLIVKSELQGKLLALYKRIVVPHLA